MTEYNFDRDDKYCYPNSSVLRNRLNILDKDTLQQAERNITALRILELRQTPPEGSMDFDYLRSLHRSIFQDLYDWAGEIRSVYIAKGNQFCLFVHIESEATELFGKLAQEDFLRTCSEARVPERLAWYLSEINAIHPFRDGNGRTQRLFIGLLAERIGYSIDFSYVSPEEMITASVRAFLREYEPMNRMLQRITSKIPG